MTDRDRQGGSGLNLPSPRSPEELDRRILDYARSRAPARRPHLRPWFAGGLATATVLVLAVYITETAIRPTAGPEPEEAVEGATPMATPMTAEPAGFADQDELSPSRQRAERRLGEAAELSMQKLAQAPERDSTQSRRQDTVQQLPVLAHLLEQDQGEEARARWQALLEQCPGCELPADLEEALQRYLPSAEQTPGD